MKKQIFAILFVGFALTAIAETNEQEKEDEMDMLLLSNENHKSWCTIKAWWKRQWCNTKAVAGNIRDEVARKNRKEACEGTYQFDIQNCAENRSLSKVDKHDYSKCRFKLDAKKYWCFVRAFFHKDGAVRTSEKAKCEADYNLNLASCPSDRLLAKGVVTDNGKHKSFCSFAAWSKKQYCKAKNLFKKGAEKAISNANCDAQYNVAIAACATARLLKKMETSIKAGNAHESWASFKSRMRWIGCKSAAAFTFNSEERKFKLAKCDAEFKARADAVELLKQTNSQ